ncbi:hypothetical protein TNCV_2877871 [Trichonephila clavipes]|uniref:Uncharacterized protein n=1 Tax=Trichonephila clavipes TaxID=2585209 RepID=A0A8X6W1R3_TRICX|nr:hypothetical protein TNCV_2877871 [Trichonephila clavipes]
MAWERKRNTETDAKGSRTLEHLMTFLRLEVQGEEMVQLAKSGFGNPIRKKDSPTERVKPTELMTASALASSVKSSVYRHCRVVFGVSSSPYLLNASIMHLLENCNSECKEVALKLKSSFYVDNCVTGVFSADEK